MRPGMPSGATTCPVAPGVFEKCSVVRSIVNAFSTSFSPQQYFQECGVKPLVVVYEELVQAFEATTRRLLQELHIPLPADLVIPEPRLKKQADPLSEE